MSRFVQMSILSKQTRVTMREAVGALLEEAAVPTIETATLVPPILRVWNKDARVSFLELNNIVNTQ